MQKRPSKHQLDLINSKKPPRTKINLPRGGLPSMLSVPKMHILVTRIDGVISCILTIFLSCAVKAEGVKFGCVGVNAFV
jgi:hypothetical protein